uniref:Uncharacterized protein n=1 Tax=Arundo donax TaxID=35708 RepID=A0A0A9BMB1_ARUDO
MVIVMISLFCSILFFTFCSWLTNSSAPSTKSQQWVPSPISTYY